MFIVQVGVMISPQRSKEKHYKMATKSFPEKKELLHSFFNYPTERK
jgi:hypothetical protein